MAVECWQTEIWEQRSGHNCPRGWSGASTAASRRWQKSIQSILMSDLYTIIIFACQVGHQHPVHPDERPLHHLHHNLRAWRCPCPSPPKNLLFQWGLGQTSPALPNGQGQLRYPPQRTRGTFGRERGQCQQVELREEGGAAGYLGGGAPI